MKQTCAHTKNKQKKKIKNSQCKSKRLQIELVLVKQINKEKIKIYTIYYSVFVHCHP